MSTQAITASLEKISLAAMPKISLRRLWLFSFILITLLLIFYVFQVSEITRSTFSVSEYEQKITKLFQENKGLEFRISQENSLVNIEAILSRYNYEKVSKINYIQIVDNKVAVGLK